MEGAALAEGVEGSVQVVIVVKPKRVRLVEMAGPQWDEEECLVKLDFDPLTQESSSH